MRKLAAITLALALTAMASPANAVDPVPMEPQASPKPAPVKPPAGPTKTAKPPTGTYFLTNTKEQAFFAKAEDTTAMSAGYRQGWVTSVEKSPVRVSKGYRKYSRSLWRVSCPTSQIALVQDADYSAEGVIVDSGGYPVSFAYTIPGSIGEGIKDFLCDPAGQIAAREVSRLPSTTEPIEYTDYLVFIDDKPGDCLVIARSFSALGIEELSASKLRTCLGREPTAEELNPPGLY